jgi:hypothetical protein
MTDQPTVEELCEYVESDEFKRRVGNVIARQAKGEDLDIPQIAEGLGIPIELAAWWAQQTAEKMRAKLIFPPTSGATN